MSFRFDLTSRTTETEHLRSVNPGIDVLNFSLMGTNLYKTVILRKHLYHKDIKKCGYIAL